MQALRDSIAKDGEAAKARMAEIEAKIAELRAERDKLAAAVKPEVLKRYGNIRMRRGLAVVSVRNGTCQGCNMNIPPQLYIIIQRGQTIETCPSCHRIIYWEDLMKDDQGDGSVADQPLRSAEPRYSRSASRSSRTGGRGGPFGRPSRKVRAPQGRVLANGQSG